MGDGSNRINNIYDVTPTEREIIEWRDKRRLELRLQYQREVHNPFRNHDGHLFDPQIQRHYSTMFSLEKLFKPTVQNFIWHAFITVGVISVVAWRVKTFRDAKEHKYRTGQISYRNRDWKFV